MDQPELPLPPPPLKDEEPYVPARMVNEFQYCPRLAYLEWVQGEWAESADTVEGRGAHRRVDRGPGELPEPEALGDDERIHARSVTLSSDRLGLIARLDLIEVEDGSVVPVGSQALAAVSGLRLVAAGGRDLHAGGGQFPAPWDGAAAARREPGPGAAGLC